jgi:predicted nuclease with TOPRIM domain
MSKEVLKKLLGNLFTPEVEKALGDTELAVVNDGSYIPRAKFNEELKALKDQLKQRDQQLKDLEGKAAGNEEMKKELQKLQEANKTTTEEYDKKVAQLQFDFALDRALTAGKVKNTKAVKALLNLEGIKLDGEKLLGLDDQLKNLQQSDAYLFSETQPVGGGGNPPGGDTTAGENAGMNSFIRGALGR